MTGVIRKEVWDALAEAHGEKRVRVIIGLRSPRSLDTVKEALAGMGVKAALRESQSFVVARLSKEQIQKLGRLTKHVRAIWLDQPVSTAQ